MKKILALVLSFYSVMAFAEPATTMRALYFSNHQVAAWHTTIYTSADQELKPHRHDNNRVVVAFTDGILKVTNNKGAVHLLKLEKEKAYYLTRDVPGELHTDENISGHPIKVAVIEIR